MRQAHAWLSDILLHPSRTRIVQNNFITHFGEEEYVQLTDIMRKNNISVEEFLKQGQATIALMGNPTAVAVAFLEVENMLCKIQSNFVEEEVKMLSGYTNKGLEGRRYEVPHLEALFSTTAFQSSGLKIVKV